MRLSFVTKLAFICNLCLVLALLLRRYNFLADGDLKSTIIVAGYFLSFIINALAVGWWWYLKWRKKSPAINQSAIIPVINTLFFVFQCYMLIQ